MSKLQPFVERTAVDRSSFRKARAGGIAALLLLATHSWAAPDIQLPQIRTVGAGNDCNHHTLTEAIAASGNGDTIRIEGSSYGGEHLLIQDKSIDFTTGLCTPVIGGAQAQAATATQVKIKGDGGPNTSVFTITGTSSVSFTNLEIREGHSSGQGGGINFYGTGTVTLTNTSVLANTAVNGGGINFNGAGASELRLNHDTVIGGNTATAGGGGIRIEGNARLFVLAPETFIANNHTNGYGGGVLVIGPARADIGSPGYSGVAVIYNNEATRGGGISVNAGTGGQGLDAKLRLFSTDANFPVRISNNVAHGIGGGIYLQPYVSSAVENDKGYADMCGSNFRIDTNLALQGVAIYADEENNFGGAKGAGVYLDSTGCGPESAASLGAVACSLGADCNLIDGNSAYNIDTGLYVAGATVLIQDNGDLSTNRLVMRENVGDYLIRTIGTRDTSLKNTLMVDNALTQAVIVHEHDDLGYSFPMTIDNCTIANNAVGGSYVIRNGAGMKIYNSIIDVADTATVLNDGGSLEFGYLLIDDSDGVPQDSTVTVGQPTFVDAANGDYRLRYSSASGVVTKSLGLDFAPAIGGSDVRIKAHDQDLPGVANTYGPRDLGAYEMQPFTDRIFADRFTDPLMLAF